jgi:hypothetical protein
MPVIDSGQIDYCPVRHSGEPPADLMQIKAADF